MKPLVIVAFIPEAPTYLAKSADGKYSSIKNTRLNAHEGNGVFMRLAGSPTKENTEPTMKPQSALTNNTLVSRVIFIHVFT